MALATWWSTDPLPRLPVPPGFRVTTTIDEARLAALNRITLDEVRERRSLGHHPYVGMIDDAPEKVLSPHVCSNNITGETHEHILHQPA